MRQVLSRAVVAAALGSVLLSGCTSSVSGTATAAHQVTDVSDADFPITGATDSGEDRIARNTLADLNTFWSQQYPENFGEDFQPLTGGYFSVDTDDIDYSLYPSDTGVGCSDLPIDPQEVQDNAFYQPDCDVIVYDKVLLRDEIGQFGPYIGAAILAHEFGHAMQDRFGYSNVTVRDETQADCFSGAFTRWVADGNAAHTTVRVQDLDKVLLGFIDLRDPVGETGVDVEGAHGSGFDRVSGFYEGYTGGVASCRDDFGSDRVFTVGEFDRTDAGTEGNAPYDQVPDIIDGSLPVFYSGDWLDGFDQPGIQTFDGSAPDCGGTSEADRDVEYCPDDNTVYADEQDLLQPAYNDIGDYAYVTAVALPYAQAARAFLGRSTDDADATESEVCLTGSFSAAFFNGDFDAGGQGTTLSPGDLDEAILFLLSYGQTESVLPHTGKTGFELVGAFRNGFLQGAAADACHLQD